LLKYKIKLIAIAKDESAYLTEWIHHHFYFGVDAIQIAINNTTDSSVSLLEKLSQDLPVSYSIEDELSRRYGTRFQFKMYQVMVEQAKNEGFTHVLLLDIDEFWVPRDFKTSIKQALTQIGEADSYVFHWFKHCDEKEFSSCFKERVLGSSTVQVKSMLALHAEHDDIRIHNSYGDFIYKIANGEMYSFSEEDKHRSRISKVQNLSDLPFMVVHRMYRSQMEYVSLLLRGRPNGYSIKDNRNGYYTENMQNDEMLIPEELLSRYNESLASLIDRVALLEDLEQGKAFVKRRYQEAMRLFKKDNLSDDDLLTLNKVLKGVTTPEVQDTLEKVKSHCEIKGLILRQYIEELKEVVTALKYEKKSELSNRIQRLIDLVPPQDDRPTINIRQRLSILFQRKLKKRILGQDEVVKKLRSIALSCEKEGFYQTALELMSIASELRPKGKLMANKIIEYKKRLKIDI